MAQMICGAAHRGTSEEGLDESATHTVSQFLWLSTPSDFLFRPVVSIHAGCQNFSYHDIRIFIAAISDIMLNHPFQIIKKMSFDIRSCCIFFFLR
jgi:hypothetical protein